MRTRRLIQVLTLALWVLPALALAQVDPIGALYGGYVANPGPTSSPAFKLEMHKLAAAGQNDSHSIEWTGRSYDTAVHQSDWRCFVDVTSNAGASTLDCQSRIDAAAFTSRFAVTDGGNATIAGTLTNTGAVSLNGAVTLGDAAADSITVTGSLASDVIFAEDTARTIRPANQATAATVGDALSVKGGAGNTTGAGGALNLVGGAGGATDATGGAVNLDGGVDGGTGIGGDVTLDGGVGDTNGNVAIAGTTGGLKVGASTPMTITNIRIYTLTNADLHDNSVAANSCEDQAVTVTGIAATDTIIVTMTTADLTDDLTVEFITPATNTLTARVCNPTAGALTQDAVADFRIIAISGS